MNNRLFNRWIFSAVLLAGAATFFVVGCQKANDKQPASTEPKYKGGVTAWLHFLNTTVRYPEAAVNDEISGTVAVKFLVNTDGTVSDVKALSGANILQQEAIRVIRASGPWEPAIVDGHRASAYKTQPIVFKLEVQ